MAKRMVEPTADIIDHLEYEDTPLTHQASAEIARLRAENERLRDDLAAERQAHQVTAKYLDDLEKISGWPALDKVVGWPAVQAELDRLRAENERLEELLRGVGANRYWEGRWRDEHAENALLRKYAVLQSAKGSDLTTAEYRELQGIIDGESYNAR